MAKFVWKGVNQFGRLIEGELESFNIRLAKEKLQAQSIVLKSIKKKQITFNFYQKRISSAEILVLMRQLVTLLTAGIPLLQALTSIQSSADSKMMQHLLRQVCQKIRSGSAFSVALELYPHCFDHFTRQFVRLGEQTGTLDLRLNEIVIHQEKQLALSRKIKNALLYPLLVISIALIVLVVFIIFIIPKFTALFSDFGAILPLPTRLVIAFSTFCQHYALIGFLGLGLLVILLILLNKKNKKVACFFDRIVLLLPLFGGLIKKSNSTLIMQTLRVTLQSGLSLTEGINILILSIRNQVFKEAMHEIKLQIESGQSLCHAFRQVKLFSSLVEQMVAIGEEGGKLDNMLEKIAEHYENEIYQMAEKLNQLLEPLVMIVLGIIIGILIIAMYLPIFKLGMVV